MRGLKTWLLGASALVAVGAWAQDADAARQLLRQGQAQQAAAAYTVLIERSPGDPDHWLGRGLANARQALWPEAMTDLEKAVALAPGYADAWSALADVYRWNDRTAAAADAYARLAVLRPNDAQVAQLRAKSLVALTSETLNPVAPTQAYQWAVSGGLSRTASGSSSAHGNSLSVRRYGELGSIAVERLGLRRYGYNDQAWAVDAYPRLWQGAYANVRYQYTDAPELYPARSWRAELYQNVGGGWELAASHDHLGFGSGVNIDGISVGKYWGNFFARWRHQRVKSDSSSGSGDRLFVRYYYEGDADHYVEANLSRGRSDDFSSALIQSSRSDSRGLVWYHFVTRDWGFKLSASRSMDSSGNGVRATDAGIGLTRRW